MCRRIPSYQQLEVESDSKVMVDILKQARIPDGAIGCIVNDIQLLAMRSLHVYVPIVGNRDAHLFTSFG